MSTKPDDALPLAAQMVAGGGDAGYLLIEHGKPGCHEGDDCLLEYRVTREGDTAILGFYDGIVGFEVWLDHLRDLARAWRMGHGAKRGT